MIVIASDPGINNGVVVVDAERNLLHVGEIVAIGDGASRRLDVHDLAAIVTRHGVTHGVIEDVSAMPRQGVSSTFRFGRAAGTIEGALGALGLPLVFVKPNQWKRDLKLQHRSPDALRGICIQTWPDKADAFSRKKDHDRAEAALIALWFLQHSWQARRAA